MNVELFQTIIILKSEFFFQIQNPFFSLLES